MKKILIHARGAANNSLFNPDERDGYNDPYIFLRERLASLGYELRTSDSSSLEDCSWVFFYDSPSVEPYRGIKGKVKKLKDTLLKRDHCRDLYDECIRFGMKDRIALFLWEAPAVMPDNWRSDLHELFPVIFTWNDGYVDNRKYYKIHWPQTRKFPLIENKLFQQKKLLVNISMNKYSSHPRELYSARRSVIEHFEKELPHDFDLFGVGWNRPATPMQRMVPCGIKKYASYKGTLKNKWDALPNYKFSLCYENIYGEPGWITEKIFDSMRAGCVPIYWGAPNISSFVDPNAFIDRRNFKSNEELKLYLSGVTEGEYEQFQKAIQGYLRGKDFAKFLPPAYADTIINTLHL